MALSAVMTVDHGGHEDTSSTGGSRALLARALDLAVRVHLVELEHGELFLLVRLLHLLGLGVGLCAAREERR